jgi:transposase
VTGAQVQDSQTTAAGELLVRLRRAVDEACGRLRLTPRLTRVFADGGYRGTADLWARQCNVVLLRVKRIGRAFEKLPKRWVVERTFAWLADFRRLLFDLEYKITNSEGMLWLAGVCIMLNRIWPRTS